MLRQVTDRFANCSAGVGNLPQDNGPQIRRARLMDVDRLEGLHRLVQFALCERRRSCSAAGRDIKPRQDVRVWLRGPNLRSARERDFAFTCGNVRHSECALRECLSPLDLNRRRRCTRRIADVCSSCHCSRLG
jgi:hypothetical protein